MSVLRDWTREERASGQAMAAAFKTFAEGSDSAAFAEDAEVAHVADVQARHELELLSAPNVVGVATGPKWVGGQPTRRIALVVLVEKKVPTDELPDGAAVPAEIDGVPTDVLEVGPIQALAYTANVRPAEPGYSIGHPSITAGTFGCVVEDVRNAGDYFILSNNHVLAASNAGSAGDLILQPGPFDGGVYPSDAIATLERFEPITFSPFPNPTGYNLVDAAVARPTSSRNMIAKITGPGGGYGLPRGIGQAFPFMQVNKTGRTTMFASGWVLAVNATVIVQYAAGLWAKFRQQILTTAMSAGGDSGSLLVDRCGNAVGLLFAGSPSITVHNHISDVTLALRVRPVTAVRCA